MEFTHNNDGLLLSRKICDKAQALYQKEEVLINEKRLHSLDKDEQEKYIETIKAINGGIERLCWYEVCNKR